MTSLAYDSALELAKKIRNKEVSSEELTKLYIDRIEKYDGDVNAVVVRIFERALEDARAADSAVARGGDLPPLHGVPMTIKESYVVEGTASTWGLEDFRNNVAGEDGLSVKRFRQAGAHFLGKTNVPVNLADFQSYNPVYGTTGNPWDTSRTPGGSSGGSAASLAAGFCGLEAGSDIGGSIRNPAHFCGVYGHKPTYGVIPLSGHELVSGLPDVDLAVCGPLARSADDLHVALDVMAGPVERDALGWQLSLPPSDVESLEGLRVAIWPTDELAMVSNEMSERVRQVGDALSNAGAIVSDTARPAMDLEEAMKNYQTLLTSVMTFAMDEDMVAGAEAVAAGFDKSDNSMAAVSARAAVLPHRDWIHANIQREQSRRTWDEFFSDWDILVCPQMATSAFPHDHSDLQGRTIQVDNEEQQYWKQLFWAGIVVNAYLPSTVFPTGPDSNGLPIGLQAVSAPYRDHRTIAFAGLITQHIGGFAPPPGFESP